jgi:CheY-like chemotaxis protein
MPGGTGIEALKRLKQSAKTSLIPVIVLSGSVAPATSEEVKALGAIEFLLKPIGPDTLYAVLCTVLKLPTPVITPV